DTAPRRWPPRWLAFYQTKVFGAEAFAVRYFGRVHTIRVVRRHELFPHEGFSTKADRLYYKVQLHDLQQRKQPIMSRRPRRLVFVPTTWRKLSTAVEINDLFDDSPLEDRMWAEFKHLNIAAKRQWDVQVRDGRY